MIVKEVAESEKIKLLKLLLPRLSPLHHNHKYIEDELARSLAGYRGEKSLDFHLELLDADDYIILHDLRLPFKSHYFQIDILIMSSSFFLILEVKNMSGTLIFDTELQQLHRIMNDAEEVFPDPISQVYRQTFLLNEWLKRYQTPSVPIESLVIISNPHTCLKVIPEKAILRTKVAHSSSLLAKFHQMNKIHKEKRLSKKELKKLSRQLMKQHSISSSNILEKYNIVESDILKGVSCPNCLKIGMTRKKKMWYCPMCSFYSGDAHIDALKDYALLIRSTITNKQCCEFLQISSRFVAHHILSSLSLPVTGTNKGRKYHLDFDDK